MKTFKQFLKQPNRFVWDYSHLEHHGIKESLEEKIAAPIDGNYQSPHDVEHIKDHYPSKEAHEGFLKHKNSFHYEHSSSASYYKGTGSHPINNYLRSKGKEIRHSGIPNEIKNLDHVTSYKTTEDHIVFRGGHGKKHKQSKEHFPVGHEFTDHGYTSTSFRKEVASGFNDPTKTNNTKTIHIIHVPKGTKAFHYVYKDRKDGEQELLLHRGTRFKVTHHSTDGDNHYIHSRVISQRGDDRGKRFSWDHDDLEHHGIKESLEERTIDSTPAGEVDKKEFLNHHKQLPIEQKHSIFNYKSGDNYPINTSLRGRQYIPSMHKHKIKSLDKVTSHQTNQSFKVYRGGKEDKKKNIERFPVGHEFTDHGYTSTSFSKKIAKKHFAPTQNGKSVIHVIHVPKGTKGHHFDADSAHPFSHEDEYVLHRGTRFKVTHHTEDDDTHYIHSRVIKQRGSNNEDL